MRISDWSSDVCSSDLVTRKLGDQRHFGLHPVENDRIHLVHVGGDERHHRVERGRPLPMKLMNFRGHNAASLGAAVTILQRLSACLRPLAGAKRAEEERSRRPMDDQLSRYRQSIDNIDAALVYMLADRKSTRLNSSH